MQRRTVRVALAVAVIGLGVLAAGCVPGPPGPATLQVTPDPANFVSNGPAPFPMPITQVTVKNTGGNAVHSLAISGIEVYSIPTNGCAGAPYNGTLAPGQSCVVDIMFCPNTSGVDDQLWVVTGQDASTGATVQGSAVLHGIAT
jgi:hypothetical protein